MRGHYPLIGGLVTAALIVAATVTIAIAGAQSNSDKAVESNHDSASEDPLQFGQQALGQCRPNRVKFRTEPSFPAASTSSADFSLIAGTGFSFTQGGAGNACVIVVFTATGESDADTNIEVRARIPGIGVAEPGPIFVGRQSECCIQTKPAMQFVFPSVPPGSHAIRMDFRSLVEGNTVFLNARTVTVHHRAG